MLSGRVGILPALIPEPGVEGAPMGRAFVWWNLLIELKNLPIVPFYLASWSKETALCST